ncbi:MAG: DUF3990 domain-containing protein [Bacilli bacterium]|nr:DUF3990 domain-containing protein [Bacilli bacterium]
MIIYHGSKQVIEKPSAKGSNPLNDYGPSFYLTADLLSAKMWACKRDELGLVNKYEVRNETYAGFKILDLTDKKKYSILNWVAILAHFRKLDHRFIVQNQEALDWLSRYYIDVNQYDVVIGFRADDSYFRFPKEFINGSLAYEDLENVYLLGDLGIQYAFMSEKATASLKFVSSIECEPSFLGKYYETVKKATEALDELLAQPKLSSKTYIMDLVRKSNAKRR